MSRYGRIYRLLEAGDDNSLKVARSLAQLEVQNELFDAWKMGLLLLPSEQAEKALQQNLLRQALQMEQGADQPESSRAQNEPLKMVGGGVIPPDKNEPVWLSGCDLQTQLNEHYGRLTGQPKPGITLPLKQQSILQEPMANASTPLPDVLADQPADADQLVEIKATFRVEPPGTAQQEKTAEKAEPSNPPEPAPAARRDDDASKEKPVETAAADQPIALPAKLHEPKTGKVEPISLGELKARAGKPYKAEPLAISRARYQARMADVQKALGSSGAAKALGFLAHGYLKELTKRPEGNTTTGYAEYLVDVLGPEILAGHRP